MAAVSALGPVTNYFDVSATNLLQRFYRVRVAP
jgi:hypothetical protein